MRTLIIGSRGIETATTTPELPMYCKVRFEGYGHGDGAIISAKKQNGDYDCVSICEGDHFFFHLGEYARPLSKKFGIGVYYYDSLETVEKSIVLDMVEKAMIADAAKKAKEIAEKEAYEAERASMPTLHPHLKPLTAGYSKDHKAARKANLCAELYHKFPGIVFSVRNEHGSTYNIRWEDGPTDREVSAVLNQFKTSYFDGMTDSNVYYSNAFADVFGSFEYLFTHRSWSKACDEVWEANKHFWGNNDRDVFNESFRETSYPAGAKITGFDFNTCQITFTAPEPKSETDREGATISAQGVYIEDYNEKSFVVRGDTKPIKDDLKALGGFFSFRLKGGPAWCFSLKKKEQVQHALGLLSILFLLFVICPTTATAQLTSYSGKTIPVTQYAGADITLAPINNALKAQFYGWLQIRYTVYPVYQGARGGLYVERTSKEGVKRNEYVTDKRDQIVVDKLPK